MTRLLRRLERIEALRDALLAELDEVPPDRRTVRPGPDRWSPVEIVEHLVLAERDVLGDLGPGEPTPRRWPTLVHRIRYGAVWAVLRFGIPVRTPSRGMDPTGERSPSELREAWVEGHRRLRRFLEGLDREGRRRPVFHHPVAGPLTPGAALRLMETHMRRHAGQLRRTRREGPAPDVPDHQRG